MHKFPIYNYKSYAELPLDEMDKQRFAIYLVSFDWKYLFINSFAFDVHGIQRDEASGAKLWDALAEKMSIDTQFKVFIEKVKSGEAANVTTISAITNKRVSITGYPLADCYYFAVTILPDKDDLISELRRQLKK
jgi:hypothetical protein